MDKVKAKVKIKELIEKYEHLSPSQIKGYLEANTRKDFILPLFQTLGWDVYNQSSYDEVTEEYQVSGKRVDYAFKIDGIIQFFLEAKSLPENLYDEKWAEQAFNYAWHKSIPWVILCDFEGLMVFNAEWDIRNPENSCFINLTYKDYLTDFEKLWWLSKDSFHNKILDNEAVKLGKKPKTIIDKQLAEDLVRWRAMLLSEISSYYPKLDLKKSDESVQRILDRLVFIRTVEDRGIENRILQPVVRNWQELKSIKVGVLINELTEIFKRFDKDYNSRLFKSHTCDSLTKVDDNIYVDIINELYKTRQGTRYNFNDIPADIFGRIYEQYLGAIQQKSATIKNNRKSQGIYYTPRFVVEYITKNTIGDKLTESLSEPRDIKILDPACGSGSFLIAVFKLLDDYWRQIQISGQKNTIKQNESFNNYLRRLPILKNNIYGVDLDTKAVEIAQLNLMLKVLESQNLLPNLEENIKQGNSLIFKSANELKKFYRDPYKDKMPFNWPDEFKEVFNKKNPGFDIIVGNPPWGSNIDVDVKYFEKYYPDSTKQYKDIYKIFIDKSLQLLKNNGILGFIVPNTFLFQSRYKDIRQLLLKYKILKLVNLGENVFEDVEAPCCIFIVKKTHLKDNIVEVLDLSPYKTNDIKEKMLKISSYVKIKQDDYFNTPDNIFTTYIQEKKEGVLPLDEILDCRDAGINYQRIKVGLQEKGKSDLSDRLFYNGKILDRGDKNYLKGEDISRYKLTPSFERFIRPYYKEFIKNNEVVHLDIETYDTKPKIIWRQTASYIIATIDIIGYWFGRSIQTGIIKNKYKNKIDIHYLLALLNSKYLNYLYTQNVRETGRVFPQVKLGKVKILPIKLGLKGQRKILSDLAKTILKLNEQLLSLQNDDIKHPEEEKKIYNQLEKTDREINQKVYELYSLTEQEIKNIEITLNH